LIEVRCLGAVIAGVSDIIAVIIKLIRIGSIGAIISFIGDSVAVKVGCFTFIGNTIDIDIMQYSGSQVTLIKDTVAVAVFIRAGPESQSEPPS
jgi:hypothetical protein